MQTTSKPIREEDEEFLHDNRRFMETRTLRDNRPREEIHPEPHTQTVSQETELSHQMDPRTYESTLARLYHKYCHQDDPEAKSHQLREETAKKAREANETYETEIPMKTYYTPLNLSPEILMTDTVLKSSVAHLDEIGMRIGVQMQKSTELASEWNTHIQSLDKYIKSIAVLPWRKTLTYSACFVGLFAFLWKMGALRKLPDFLSSVLACAPTMSTASPVINEVNIPKPDIEYTLKAFMESPLTPLTLVSGVGVLTIGLGSLKLILWVLRKVPK